MNINSAFPSKYLKSSDLAGRQVIVTIDRVEMEMIDDEDKAVIYFTGKKKGMILNVTNKNMLVEICDSAETTDWHGAQITLFVTKVEFQGKRVDGLRVDYAKTEKPPPSPSPPPPAELTDDDIPF